MAATARPSPIHIQCSVSGTKLVVPAITADQACTRFIRAFGAASGKPVTSGKSATLNDGLIVEIHFKPRGMAAASATRMRAGRVQRLPLFQMAVSDRAFAPGDIDSLAADVARGMTTKTAGAERG